MDKYSSAYSILEEARKKVEEAQEQLRKMLDTVSSDDYGYEELEFAETSADNCIFHIEITVDELRRNTDNG